LLPQVEDFFFDSGFWTSLTYLLKGDSLMANFPIWIRDDTGVRTLYPTLPNCWQGEAGCIVGPFSSKTVAEYFIQTSVDFGQYDAILEEVFASGDGWYVEAKPLNA
jgi:hypothetical protein